MILVTLFLSIAFICLAWMGWTLWVLQRTIREFGQLHKTGTEESVDMPENYQGLTRQVDELQETMGGVVQSLRAVGHQVYNLNRLAGYALRGAIPKNNDDAGATQEDGSEGPQQIMLEIRHRRSGHGENNVLDNEGQPIAPEDMSPEMQEKVRIFQSVYMAVMTSPTPLPSLKRPDLN